jgi:hypothetical protein
MSVDMFNILRADVHESLPALHLPFAGCFEGFVFEVQRPEAASASDRTFVHNVESSRDPWP